MIVPSWQDLLTLNKTAFSRRRVTLMLSGNPLVVSLIGESTFGVVEKANARHSEKPGDVIWVKRVAADGKRVSEDDIQRPEEGLPGLARGLERITLVEGGKGAALARSATQIDSDILALLSAENDKTPFAAFSRHLALLDLLGDHPEALKRLEPKERTKARHMLGGCLTIRDRTERKNPHSRVMKARSAQRYLRSMNEQRMTTAENVAVQATIAQALMDQMSAFITEVRTHVENKIDTMPWLSAQERPSRLRHFAERLLGWSTEFEQIDMHPFRKDAQEVQRSLLSASNLIATAIRKKRRETLYTAKKRLEAAVNALLRMEARFNIAEALRVVGTAKDERIVRLGLAIKTPTWAEIEDAVSEAYKMWGATQYVRTPEEKAPQEWYDFLRNTVRYYDDASRSAIT